MLLSWDEDTNDTPNHPKYDSYYSTERPRNFMNFSPINLIRLETRETNCSLEVKSKGPRLGDFSHLILEQTH